MEVQQALRMAQYAEYIRDLALTNENAVFYNTGASHASYVMSTIFDFSQNKIQILAGAFTGEVSELPNYRQSLDGYLNRGGKLEILLHAESYQKYKEKHEKEPKIFDILKFYNVVKPGHIHVRLYDDLSPDLGEIVHFTVSDKKMYRLEYDTEEFKAECNFNDPTEAKKLEELFTSIFNRSSTQKVSLAYN